MLLQTCVIIVRGLPQSTTEDTVLNYFENTRRSGGGAVEEVKIEGSVARVKFESSEGNLVVMFTFIKSGDELISRDQLCNFVTKSRLKNLPYFKHVFLDQLEVSSIHFAAGTSSNPFEDCPLESLILTKGHA